MKKLLSISLVILMLVSVVASASAEAVQPAVSETAQVPWTIFVYLCGSDLESENGFASYNLEEMVEASTNSNVRFVVQTGGASSWESNISAERLERYEILGGESVLADAQTFANMGDGATLASFLQWGLATYNSPYYGLVLWNHGSGSINGVCFDENYSFSSLRLTDMESALKSTSSLLPNGFEFVGFDACLMGTVETAAMLAPYTHYMIGSQELEPGTGWDYGVIGDFLDENPDADGLALGSAICDGFFAACVEVEQGDSATLSVVDLTQIADLRVAFDAYAKDLYTVLDQGDDFAPIARAINSVDNFGGNNRTEGYTNMVDMGGLIAAGRKWSDHADAAWDSLLNAVKYEVKGPDHIYSTGLSLYYPLQIEGSEELSIFKDVCISAYYLGLVDKVAYGYANGGNMENYDTDSSFSDLLDLWAQSGGDDMNQFFSAADWSYLDDMEDDYQSTAITFTEPPFVDENGSYGFILDENGINNALSVEANLFLLSDNGDYIGLGTTSDILGDWETGVFQDDFDGYWFSLGDGQPLCTYLVSQCDGYDLFTSPILLNGEETNLRFTWDYANSQLLITGIWDGIEEEGYSSRPTTDLKPGDVIIPVYDSYEADTFEDAIYNGEPYTFAGSEDLSFGLLPEGEYLYSFCINDIYGGFWNSDPIRYDFTDGTIYFNAAA